MLNPKRATGVSGDTISSYEYDLTTIRRVAWFRRGTKRTDIPADFVARDNRLLRHSDHGTAEQQTLSCGKDGRFSGATFGSARSSRQFSSVSANGYSVCIWVAALLGPLMDRPVL